MNLIIFGPPGAGKGTQSQLVAKKFNLYQLSTGDLLRNEVRKNSEFGRKIEEIISNGEMVTDGIIDSLILKVVTNSIYRNRIIFDGYPRNISQAKNLEKILSSDNQSIFAIFYLNVSRDIVEQRIKDRLTCEKCNKTFNEFSDKKEI